MAARQLPPLLPPPRPINALSDQVPEARAYLPLRASFSPQGTAQGAAGVFPCGGGAVGVPSAPPVGPPVAVAVVSVWK